MEGMRTSSRNAKPWGANTRRMLVPVEKNPETTHAQACGAQPVQIRRIPFRRGGQGHRYRKRVEQVSLSPAESGLLRGRFGHCGSAPTWISATSLSSYPQDWIRTGRRRIVKLHFEDFSFKKRLAEFTPLLEGEIDWRAVHAAIAEIGYQGAATVELSGGDAAYLKEVNTRFEKILAGQV